MLENAGELWEMKDVRDNLIWADKVLIIITFSQI
jgi:hypothetical protein